MLVEGMEDDDIDRLAAEGYKILLDAGAYNIKSGIRGQHLYFRYSFHDNLLDITTRLENAYRQTKLATKPGRLPDSWLQGMLVLLKETEDCPEEYGHLMSANVVNGTVLVEVLFSVDEHDDRIREVSINDIKVP
jgi:hypothetical protein